MNFFNTGWLFSGESQLKKSMMKLIAALITTFGLAATAAFAVDNTGNAPGGTGIEQASGSMGATQKQDDTSAPDQMKTGANSTDEGGTGIKGSAEGKGATDKSTDDPTAPMGSKTGMSTGNAPGGTGVEQSTEGQGSTNKN